MIEITDRCRKMALSEHNTIKERAVIARYIKLAMIQADQDGRYLDYCELEESLNIFIHRANKIDPFFQPDYSSISNKPINFSTI